MNSIADSNVIQILADNLINKIAAGEVIERPASVVKELVENALDAGADTITIAVEAGGNNLVQVTDNGGGMSKPDLLLSVERHATSKIGSYDDLTRVRSLGFRGEALASIAAVARLEIRTAQPEAEHGYLLEVEDGEIKRVDSAPPLRGTQVVIRNLFYSTPVRRKFLTSTKNELRRVIQIARHFFLAYPEVAFRLISEGEELFNLPAQDLKARLSAIYNDDINRKLMLIEGEENGIRVSGFLGKMTTFRRSYGEQFLFVNRRFISNRVINHAVFSAYGNMLERGQVPFFLLNLELDPERIDVNVHPTKREIKFENESLIHQLVNRLAQDALRQGAANELELSSGDRVRLGRGANEFELPAGDRPQHDRRSGAYPAGAGSGAGARAAGTQRVTPQQFELQGEMFGAQTDSAAEGDDVAGAPVATPLPTGAGETGQPQMWQIHRKYILAEVQSGLIIVDQHVAHERILYEQALATFQGQRCSGQRVLFPVKFSLLPDEEIAFEELAGMLTGLGYSFVKMGEATWVIEEVPADLKQESEERLIRDIIAQYGDYRDAAEELREAMAATFACKAAIKAGEPLTQAEMRYLIDSLFACRYPYACPHGRPVVMNLTLAELDKRFGRT